MNVLGGVTRNPLIKGKTDSGNSIFKKCILWAIFFAGFVCGIVVGQWTLRDKHAQDLKEYIAYCNTRVDDVLFEIDMIPCIEWHYTDNGWEGPGLENLEPKIEPEKRKRKGGERIK